LDIYALFGTTDARLKHICESLIKGYISDVQQVETSTPYNLLERSQARIILIYALQMITYGLEVSQIAEVIREESVIEKRRGGGL
jgi:hypothetical protein